jgi:D-beta-D-heptose 7-phosphate kinase/D-beta-D-heptose 1-phosphate adenosyltransferase
LHDPNSILNLLDKIEGRNVLVLGDVTLDKFIVGRVNRISPEAPVALVEVEQESYSLGAAANVINNLSSLGANVTVTTVVGDDPEGEYLIRELAKMNVETRGVFKQKGRMTALVTRIRTVSDYQLLRLDKSKDESVGQRLTSEIASFVDTHADKVDIVLISDYGRGAVTPELLPRVIEASHAHGKKVVGDPKKENFWHYRGADVVRTNRREAGYVTGITPVSEASVRIMGQKIISSLGCGGVLITWIEEGFHLFEGMEKVVFFSPLIKHPVELTGVGDAITCGLTLGLATQASLANSCLLANYAGAVSASKRGLSAVTRDEIREAIRGGISCIG